jgi:hypothetical protein
MGTLESRGVGARWTSCFAQSVAARNASAEGSACKTTALKQTFVTYQNFRL